MARVRQRDEAWLRTATPDQVTQARDAGELNELLGRRVPVVPDGQADDEQLSQMTPEEIARAYDSGQLDELLGRAPGG